LYDVGNSVPTLGQAQKSDEVKPVNWITHCYKNDNIKPVCSE